MITIIVGAEDKYVTKKYLVLKLMMMIMLMTMMLLMTTKMIVILEVASSIMMMIRSMNSDDCSDRLECRCPTVISNGSLHVL